MINNNRTHVVAELDGRIYLRLGLAAVVLHGRQPRHLRRAVIALGRREIDRLVRLVGRAGVARFRRVQVVRDRDDLLLGRGDDDGRRHRFRDRRKTPGRRRRFRRTRCETKNDTIKTPHNVIPPTSRKT